MNEIAPIKHSGTGNRVRLDRQMVLGMAKAGLLDHLHNYELEDGVLIEMSPSNSPHGIALSYVNALLIEKLPLGLVLASDTFLFLTDHDMRAPDIAVVPIETNEEVFEPQHIVLCVEIASATLQKDTNRKATEYAAHGIPEYWVVDLPNRLLHIHRDPAPDGYARIVAQGWDKTVRPLCAPDVAIRPADRLDRVIK